MAETKKPKKVKKDRTAKENGAGIPKTRLDYNDEMLLLEIEGYARDGYDNEQIAELLGVNPATFSKHKNIDQPDGKKSKLSEALKRGRRPLSVLVENALYKRATGMSVKTTIIRKLVHPDGTETDINIVQETISELPPDTGAAAFWLKNHKPEIYNAQPIKYAETDTKGNDKPSSDMPKIVKIEHVTVDAATVKKIDAEV